MKRLFEIDLKDYKESDNVFRRPSARAIIRKGDKIALVYSQKEKYYKFPGCRQTFHTSCARRRIY